LLGDLATLGEKGKNSSGGYNADGVCFEEVVTVMDERVKGDEVQCSVGHDDELGFGQQLRDRREKGIVESGCESGIRPPDVRLRGTK
jgi:hypothetical protein